MTYSPPADDISAANVESFRTPTLCRLTEHRELLLPDKTIKATA